MNYWLRIGGPNAITVRAWLVLAPISVFLTFGFTPEGTQGPYLLWMFVGLLGHLATGIVLFLAWLTYLSNRPRKSRPISAVLTFALAGLARGATVSFSSEYFGLLEQAEYFLRMRSGAGLVVFWFGFSAIMIDASKKYRDSYLELQGKLRDYSTLESSTANAVQNFREEIVKEVEATITKAFSSQPNSSQLKEVVSLVVAPLSRQLYTKDKFPEIKQQIDSAINQSRRVPTKSVFITVFSHTPFNPGIVSILALGGTLASRLWTTPVGTLLLDVALNVLIIFSIFGIANRATRQKPALRALFAIPVWLITGIFGSVVTFYLGSFQLPSDFSGIFLLSTNSLAASLFSAILVAYEHQREEKLKQLAEVTSRAEWLRARTNQALWSERKRLARVIHSSVQSRLLATATRLSRSEGDRGLTEEELNQVRIDCQRAMLAPERIEPIDSFVHQIREIWEGAMDIRFAKSESLSELINRDASAAAATLEVIREAINNAAKHTDANEIQIEVEIDDKPETPGSFLSLTIINNGVNKEEKSSFGLGSQILSDLGADWNLEISENLATLRAKIPLLIS